MGLDRMHELSCDLFTDGSHGAGRSVVVVVVVVCVCVRACVRVRACVSAAARYLRLSRLRELRLVLLCPYRGTLRNRAALVF